MALPLKFELRLEDRGGERVLVSALLAPEGDAVRLDGVALQLHTRTGEPLGIRLLLPISGELRQPMLSTVELRCDEVPMGAKVVGIAWLGREQREATIPTDPFTELEVHMRGRRRIVTFAEADGIDVLERAERDRIARDFPWIDEPRIPRAVAELEVVEGDDEVDQIIDELGLDEESAEWLEELLREE
ncbi:MAG: hypothetical protein H6738_15420 [Alphaproteobacteria bacterium]|nr:hypothetical protein [Alphaproteobacteria bacterium]MCB9698168.1 hypothetical protein [Alphaproteobacteria bacterium]